MKFGTRLKAYLPTKMLINTVLQDTLFCERFPDMQFQMSRLKRAVKFIHNFAHTDLDNWRLFHSIEFIGSTGIKFIYGDGAVTININLVLIDVQPDQAWSIVFSGNNQPAIGSVGFGSAGERITVVDYTSGHSFQRCLKTTRAYLIDNCN